VSTRKCEANVSMKIKQYVREIRIRGVYIIITAMITLVCAYSVSSQIIYILAAPIEEAHKQMAGGASGNVATPTAPGFHFIFTEITEAFMAATQVSILITIYM